MATAFIGQITLFGGNFAIRSWAMCDGQLLSIAQNTALFSILGTTFGGNGTTTFGLPDLRGRVPVHAGQGPGLTPYLLGEKAGTESTTLTINNMPAHTHTARASNADATDASPGGNVPAAGGAYHTTSDANMKSDMITPAGGSQPFNNVQPYLAVTFLICLQGIFPSRN